MLQYIVTPDWRIFGIDPYSSLQDIDITVYEIIQN